MLKFEGWHWWMRWRRPIATFFEHGCVRNTCGWHPSVEGCECNDYHAATKIWRDKGFKLVGQKDGDWTGGLVFYYSDGKDVVHCHYTCGR